MNAKGPPGRTNAAHSRGRAAPGLQNTARSGRRAAPGLQAPGGHP